jgi:hypothetical protein
MSTTFGPPRADTIIVTPLEDTRVFWRTAGLFGVLTAAFLIWVTLGIGGHWLTNAVDDLGELAAALVAVVLCAVASRRAFAARSGWVLMGLSGLAWASGEVLWSYYDLVRGNELPTPSVADLGFLAAVPLAVVGLHRLFSDPRRQSVSPLGVILSVMVLGTGALIVVRAQALPDVDQTTEVVQRLVGLAYPLGDVMMAAVVVAAFQSGFGDVVTKRLVLAGIIAFTISDSYFAVGVTMGKFGLGYWLDTGWVVGYLLLALGALWESQQSTAQRWMNPAPITPRRVPTTRQANARTDRVVYHGATNQHWLAMANADHLVNYVAITLMLVDASVVLWDLAVVMKMLA